MLFGEFGVAGVMNSAMTPTTLISLTFTRTATRSFVRRPPRRRYGRSTVRTTGLQCRAPGEELDPRSGIRQAAVRPQGVVEECPSEVTVEPGEVQAGAASAASDESMSWSELAATQRRTASMIELGPLQPLARAGAGD